MKDVDKIIKKDFEEYPIWEFVNEDPVGELKVKPVTKYPVKNPEGKIFGMNVTTKSGKQLFAFIGNFTNKNEEMNEHFATISIWVKNTWFHLARYHDIGYNEEGPKKLEEVLQMKNDEIFPIDINIGKYINGYEKIFSYKEPDIKLSRSELIKLSITKK